MARPPLRKKIVSAHRVRRGWFLMMFGAIMFLIPASIAIFGYTGQIIVATPQTAPPFDHAVVYIDHDSVFGAVGIILNRPMTEEQHAHLPAYIREAHIPVGYGGPLEPDHVVVIEEKIGPKGLKTFDANDWDTVVHDTPDILARIRDDYSNHREHYRVFAGLAGWSMLQLAHEVVDGGAWLPTTPTHDIIFQTGPNADWDKLYPIVKVRHEEKAKPVKLPNQT